MTTATLFALPLRTAELDGWDLERSTLHAHAHLAEWHARLGLSVSGRAFVAEARA